ncbi:dentin sialophosphoprotein-like [Clytia hemisphaerica]|uniref:WD repeat-containing protein 79 n=1 Tax=Clytia hemisphaerica TaxID=252671 RepID=A0A7M5U291_9CNID|eukprot:TCONS_00007097-protein
MEEHNKEEKKQISDESPTTTITNDTSKSQQEKIDSTQKEVLEPCSSENMDYHNSTSQEGTETSQTTNISETTDQSSQQSEVTNISETTDQSSQQSEVTNISETTDQSSQQSELTNISETTDQSSQQSEVTRVSETTDTSLTQEAEVDNFNIQPAVCSVCGKEIPNLFDVIDNRTTDTVTHYCERCEVIKQKNEFMFAERQKSVEEVVIVSDEETKKGEKKIEIVNLENIKIKKEGKKRKSQETKHSKPSKVPKKSARQSTKTKTADVITLSSSSSGDDENDDVIIEQGFKRKVHGIFMKPFVSKHKTNDVIEKVDITDEDVKHPKYKLYQNNKEKASKSPISKSSITGSNIASITVEKKDGVSSSKSAVVVSTSPTIKPIILSPITVEDSKDKPVVISPTPIDLDHSLEQPIDDLECHTQNVADNSLPSSLETSSQIEDSTDKVDIDDSDLVIERKVEKQAVEKVITSETEPNTEKIEREEQNDNAIKGSLDDPPNITTVSNVDEGEDFASENTNTISGTKLSEESFGTNKTSNEKNQRNNVETKSLITSSQTSSQDSGKTEVNNQSMESELDETGEKTELSNSKEQNLHSTESTDDEDKELSAQTETTVIPETPPSIVESSSQSNEKNDSHCTTLSKSNDKNESHCTTQSKSNEKNDNHCTTQSKSNDKNESHITTPSQSSSISSILPSLTSDAKDPDNHPCTFKEDSSFSKILSKDVEPGDKTRNTEQDLKPKELNETNNSKTDDETSTRQTSKKKSTTSNKYSGISAFLANFEGHATNNMADEVREEPSLKELTVVEQPTLDEDTRDYQEPMETSEWKSTDWGWIERNERPKLMGVCRKEYHSSFENYLRGSYWSPDGSALLTNSDDNILRIFDTSSLDKQHHEKEENSSDLKPKVRLSEGETVYDVAWYPFMRSQDPDTCCFLATSRDHPVHLWDSNTGRVRCSYRSFDQMDEITSPHSVSFNYDGSKVYCGFNNCIRIFDSNRPGRQFVERSIVRKKTRSRKERQQKSLNQRGIVSSIAFSNQYSGLYALGTFTKTVGLYAANEDEPLFLLREHKGGITHLRFTSDGFYLFSGARKDNELIAWDMRNTSIPLFKMQREVSTNQRILFDIDQTCRYLCSGNTNNEVSVWDINNIMQNVGEEVVKHHPLFSFNAHQDAVNGISIHPTSKYIATTSGQRHFFVNDADSDDDVITMEKTKQKQISHCYDNSLKIWKT